MTVAAHRRVSYGVFLKTLNGAWLLKACPLRLKTQLYGNAELNIWLNSLQKLKS